jgi:predicted chitinase
MMKKIYILALTFLCLLCSHLSFGQGINELDEVEVYPPYEPDIDTWDCSDPNSSMYPCEYVDTGDCTDYRSYAYPCESYDPCNSSSNSYDPCLCDPSSCQGNQDPPSDVPPESCGVIVCSGLAIDRPYIVLNKDTCKCEKIPRPWYYDFDTDGWHDADEPVKTQIDSPGGGWIKTTKGADCDDKNLLVTSNCYLDYFIDNDGDDYDSGTIRAKTQGSYKTTTLGPDCDDSPDGANVHKLNKCGKCEAEPVSCGIGDCDTSVEDLKKLFPLAGDSKLIKIAEAINKYGEILGIDTQEKLQHFLAQAGVESHRLGSFKEYTNYRPARALEVFEGKFNAIGSDDQDQTKKNLSDFHTPGDTYLDAESFYNWVYADENRSVKSRLGNTQPGDGWEFRGRGIIQLTGRENYTKFSNWYKQNVDSSIDIKNNPSLLELNTEIGTISGLYFFKTKVLDKIVVNENTNISTVTKIVNTKKEGLKERKEYLIEAKNKIHCK